MASNSTRRLWADSRMWTRLNIPAGSTTSYGTFGVRAHADMMSSRSSNSDSLHCPRPCPTDFLGSSVNRNSKEFTAHLTLCYGHVLIRSAFRVPFPLLARYNLAATFTTRIGSGMHVEIQIALA